MQSRNILIQKVDPEGQVHCVQKPLENHREEQRKEKQGL